MYYFSLKLYISKGSYLVLLTKDVLSTAFDFLEKKKKKQFCLDLIPKLSRYFSAFLLLLMGIYCNRNKYLRVKLQTEIHDDVTPEMVEMASIMGWVRDKPCTLTKEAASF